MHLVRAFKISANFNFRNVAVRLFTRIVSIIEDNLMILLYVFICKHDQQADNDLLKGCVLILNMLRNVENLQYNSLAILQYLVFHS
jgi:hypothetical protein